jgi:PHD/YefM family antitoxin component YafN of YafNO toxin-antitoxin module
LADIEDKDKISKHVNAVAQTTKNGMPAAVLVSADAWQSL